MNSIECSALKYEIEELNSVNLGYTTFLCPSSLSLSEHRETTESSAFFLHYNEEDEHEALMTRFYVTLDISLNGNFYSFLFVLFI